MRRLSPLHVLSWTAWIPVLAAGCDNEIVNPGDDDASGDDTAGDDDSGADDDASPSEVVSTVPGDDWALPEGREPAGNSGLYAEDADADRGITLKSVDFTWKQLQPVEATLDKEEAGEAEGMTLDSWSVQLAEDEPFWMRLFTSAVAWTPGWASTACGVEPIGRDYEDQNHFPIWDECLWGHTLEMYRQVMIDEGLRSDPRLQFIYVPGGFTWSEFDFDVVSQAATLHGLTYEVFDTWFQQAVVDLVAIMDGENSDTSDDYSGKLVYTGEDYPFGPWDEQDDHFAGDAVAAGMGIRNGIPEEYNFHLNQAPSYGNTIDADGYLIHDDLATVYDGLRVVATENECFNDCGYSVDDPAYSVKMTSLRSLQLGARWIYALAGPSYLDEQPDLWEWLRLSLGQTAETSADAWVAIRQAEDTYWEEDESFTWDDVPWVKNWERWVRHRDVSPDGITQDGTESVSEQPTPENGTAREGRRTWHQNGGDYLYFDVDDRFVGEAPGVVDIKVTWKDTGTTPWWVEYPGRLAVEKTPEVPRTDTGGWFTTTVRVRDSVWDGSLTDGTDFRVSNGTYEDLEVRFVRVVKGVE